MILTGAWSHAYAACTIQTTALAFGEYGSLNNHHQDSVAQLEVNCVAVPGTSVSYVIKLSGGTAGKFSPRAMTQGETELTYGLFRDSARSRVWGDGTAGTEVVVATIVIPSNGRITRNHSVFGRIFSRQPVRSGSYSDLVQVTLEECATPGQCSVVMVAPLSIQ